MTPVFPAFTHPSCQNGEIEVSVVMPCLNEAATVGMCARKALEWFKMNGVVGEVIVADNGSHDNSPEIARGEGAKIVFVATKGYGEALRSGIAGASGKFVIIGDSDGTYDFSNLGVFITHLRAGCDVVNGNRFLGGIESGSMPFLHRHLGNPVLSFIARLLFRGEIGDYHCGMRGFTKASFDALKLTSPGMEFASEHMVKASLYRLKIAEVPVTLAKNPVGRRPHLRTWRDGWRHLRFLVLMSPRWLFLYPGLILIALGLFLSTGVLTDFLHVGHVRLGVHTLLAGVAFVSLGFQVVAFAFLARYIAWKKGLLPENVGIASLIKQFPLELGLLVSGLLVVSGTIAGGWSVAHWAGIGFGSLNPEETMLVFIPSIGAIVVGAQIFFFSSLLGLLEMGQT